MDTNKVRIDLLATIYITCEEIENFEQVGTCEFYAVRRCGKIHCCCLYYIIYGGVKPLER